MNTQPSHTIGIFTAALKYSPDSPRQWEKGSLAHSKLQSYVIQPLVIHLNEYQGSW